MLCPHSQPDQPAADWWLTGFRWGVLSDASEPSVDLAITLKDGVMCQAFLGGIAGCDYRNLRVDGTTVSFTFSRPFAPQTPRTPVEVAAIEEANSTVVSAYQAEGFPSNDPNVVDAEFLDVAVPQHAAHGRLLRLGREASWRANSACRSEPWSVASRPPSTSPRRLSRAVVERRRFGLRCLGRPDRELLGAAPRLRLLRRDRQHRRCERSGAAKRERIRRQFRGGSADLDSAEHGCAVGAGRPQAGHSRVGRHHPIWLFQC